MAKCYLALHEPAPRLRPALEALKTSSTKQDHTIALYYAALSERDLNLPQAALEHVREALAIGETTRLTLSGPSFRTGFSARIREQYGLAIDLAIELGREAEALELSERARARSLLESLAEAPADFRAGADPELLARERYVSGALDRAADAQLRQKTPSAEEDVRRLTAELNEIAERIRAFNLRFENLTVPQPLSLDRLRAETLDAETILLEFAIGEERSFLWVVSRDSLKTYRLPGRAAISTAVERAYQELSQPNRTGRAAAELSRMLLGEAGVQLIPRRWLVVADGALHYIPIGALPDPTTGAPWMVSHEVVYVPSASTLAVLRKETAGRAPAPVPLAIFADPVFDPHDSRVARADRVPGELAVASGPVLRALTDSGGLQLTRLRATRLEAQRIAALAPGAKVALDFSANRAAVTAPDLARYRVLHFATHGLLNTRHPELSGILLSMVNSRGERQNGFLQAHEVYDLKLNADLVVLSACRTALGTEVQGEGLIGLTRGFMYAGAPRVVASLWPVPDAATAAVMERFYRGMFKQHLAPAAALRAAQAAMRSNPETADPFYWAAFILQGEYK
jgi:CHAT domain-containing protein